MAILHVCIEGHKLSKQNGGWNAADPCEMGGLAEKEWGSFEREEEWESSVVKGVCC
jgi:hypothetical protein